MIFRKIDTTLPVCHDKRLVAERSREMVLGRRFGLDLQTRFPYPQGIIAVLVYSGEAKMKVMKVTCESMKLPMMRALSPMPT
jgi:hypothetical protein